MQLTRQTQTPTTSDLREISDGTRGTLETLKLMRVLVRNSKKSLPIRLFALSLLDSLKQKDYAGEAQRIHAFVRDNIRYVRDVRGVETLHTPEKVLELRAGDCDDKATLSAALLESIGHPTRFVALGFRDDAFSHVYVETKMGNNWVGFETTEPVKFGWTPPRATSRMVVHN